MSASTMFKSNRVLSGLGRRAMNVQITICLKDGKKRKKKQLLICLVLFIAFLLTATRPGREKKKKYESSNKMRGILKRKQVRLLKSNHRCSCGTSFNRRKKERKKERKTLRKVIVAAILFSSFFHWGYPKEKWWKWRFGENKRTREKSTKRYITKT